jgi:hypothetical protein
MRMIWSPTGINTPGRDFEWITKTQFTKTFAPALAVAYLARVRDSLVREATGLPEGNFYTGIRHAFAEIDGLGKLLRGNYGPEDNAGNVIAFGTTYLAQIDERYEPLIGLLIDMFRHGLAHTHLTKTVRFRIGGRQRAHLRWGMNDTPSQEDQHLTIQESRNQIYRLWIHVPQFVGDTVKALDRYSSDLGNSTSRSRLFTRFRRAYLGTAGAHLEPPPPAAPRTRRTVSATSSPALQLHWYARDGLQWVMNQIRAGNVRR